MLRYAFDSYDRPKTLEADLNYGVLFILKKPTSLMMNLEELEYFNNLPEIIKIYRGFRNQKQKGLSWTLNKKVAEFFAHEWHRIDDSPGTVVSIEVHKDKVYAYLNERQEEEIVTPISLQRNFTIESSSRPE